MTHAIYLNFAYWLWRTSIAFTCMTGPQAEPHRIECGVNVGRLADYDNDKDLDLKDYAEFQRRMAK